MGQKITKKRKGEIRREFLKLKLNGWAYEECQKEIETKYGKKFSIRTFKGWKRRFENGGWNLLDKSNRPYKLISLNKP